MTAAAQQTVSEIMVFRHQAGMVRQVVGVSVAGLTHQDSLIQPSPGGNCLNWVMGHLVGVYEDFLPLLGRESVLEKGALKRYARKSPPLLGGAEALNFEKLTATWDEATERIDAGLAGLSPEFLDRPAPDSPSGDPDETVRSLVSTVLFHQAYHAGQTGLLRRIAGKEGAIR